MQINFSKYTQNIMSEKTISIGIKVSLIISLIVLVHIASSFVNNLGIISDAFALLGVWQLYNICTSSESRSKIAATSKQLIQDDNVENFIFYIKSLFNKTKVEDIEGYNDFSFLDELYSTPEENTLIQEGETNPVLNIEVPEDKVDDIIARLSNEEVDLSNLESINDTYLELLTRPTE